MIERFCKEHGIADETAKALLELSAKKDRIVGNRQKVEAEQRRLDSAYKEQTRQNKLALEAVQKDCPHYEATYHGDPAGGSDSFHSCDWCKAQW